MNKLFNKIAALSVGLAMAIGVGVAVGSQRSEVRSVKAASWAKVTEISDGDVVVFAYDDNGSYREMNGVTTIGTVANASDSISGLYELSVVTGNGSGSFAFKDSDNKYLSWSSGNTLSLSDALNNYSSWKLNSVNTTAKTLKLQNVGDTTRLLQYNSGNPRLACYTSSQTAFSIFKKGSETYTVTPTNLVGWSSTRGAQSGTSDIFTISATDGLNNSDDIRNYAGSTLTISISVGTMSKAVFTCTANGTNNYGPGKMSLANGSDGSYTYEANGKHGTWTGNASTFSLEGGQSRITGIEIYYETPDVGDPTSISCDPQSINVAGTVNLKAETTIAPLGAQTDFTFAIKSGSNYIDLDTSTGIVTGKKGGSAVVTITPTVTSGGATAIDVTITVSSIAAPSVTTGNKYVVYTLDATNGNRELTGVSSNLGTATSFVGDVPSCTYPLEVEAGYFENTIALKHGSDYLALTAASNALHTKSSIDAQSSWIVTWNSETEEATLVNGARTNYSLQYNYNNGNPRFACYATTQVAIHLHEYNENPLTDFTIEPEVSVYKDDTATIGVTYTPADAADKTLTWTVTASNPSGCVTVDQEGVVSGVAVGTATVTASKVINSVTVTRSCTVTVLNNVSTHRGTEEDPFDVNDAVHVAKGIFVKDPDGDPIDLTYTYYVRGMITKNGTRTTSNLTFWIGDNASQQSAETGGFEVYKAGYVYGTALGTYYSSNNEVQRDFNVGDYVLVISTLTEYNGTAETTQNVANINWNNYIEAREYATDSFLDYLSTSEGHVCDADGDTDLDDLKEAWALLALEFDGLSDEAKAVYVSGHGSSSETAHDVNKAIALYDYVAKKYGHRLESADLTDFDFMGRNITPNSSGRIALFGNDSNAGNTFAIAVVIAVLGVTVVGGYFLLKKKKEQ